jgi:hypothetical protein
MSLIFDDAWSCTFPFNGHQHDGELAHENTRQCHYLQHQCALTQTSHAAIAVSLFVNIMPHATMSVSLPAPSVCLNTDAICYHVNVTICNISVTKNNRDFLRLLVLLMYESPLQVNCFMKQSIYTWIVQKAKTFNIRSCSTWWRGRRSLYIHNIWSLTKRPNLYPRKIALYGDKWTYSKTRYVKEYV